MENTTEQRKKLLLALNKAYVEAQNSMSYTILFSISEIVGAIKADEKQHDLAISNEEIDKVTYVKVKGAPRVRTTLRRYIRRELNCDSKKLSDVVLDNFGGIVLKHISESDYFERNLKILRGEDIYKFYKDIDVKAPCLHSCMTGHHADYVKMYAKNPNKVALAILRNANRALLWSCDDGVTVLDRIYPSGSDGVRLMKQWADKNGFLTRKNLDSLGTRQPTVPLSDGSVHYVTMKIDECKHFPYMDTFAFGTEIDKNTVRLSNGDDKACLNFSSPNGVILRQLLCTLCNAYKPHDQFRYVHEEQNKRYCNACFSVACTICSGCDQAFMKRDIIRVDSFRFCPTCAVDCVVECSECHAKTHKATAVAITGDNNVQKYFHSDCLPEHLRPHTCSICYVKFVGIGRRMRTANKYSRTIVDVCENCVAKPPCPYRTSHCTVCGEDFFYVSKASRNSEGLMKGRKATICESCKFQRRHRY